MYLRMLKYDIKGVYPQHSPKFSDLVEHTGISMGLCSQVECIRQKEKKEAIGRRRGMTFRALVLESHR